MWYVVCVVYMLSTSIVASFDWNRAQSKAMLHFVDRFKWPLHEVINWIERKMAVCCMYYDFVENKAEIRCIHSVFSSLKWRFCSKMKLHASTLCRKQWKKASVMLFFQFQMTNGITSLVKMCAPTTRLHRATYRCSKICALIANCLQVGWQSLRLAQYLVITSDQIVIQPTPKVICWIYCKWSATKRCSSGPILIHN